MHLSFPEVPFVTLLNARGGGTTYDISEHGVEGWMELLLLYEEQQNKSRSCPTRGVDQNLSFGLSISEASERVRIASKFSTMPCSKIYSGKDLG